MMTKMMVCMKTHFNTVQDKQETFFSNSIPETNSRIKYNQEFIKKIEFNLNDISLTVSKIEHRLSKEEEVYRAQCQSIDQCITDVSTYVSNNK
eukprot:11937619-Ditylum_brightwellii.AAC.1